MSLVTRIPWALTALVARLHSTFWNVSNGIKCQLARNGPSVECTSNWTFGPGPWHHERDASESSRRGRCRRQTCCAETKEGRAGVGCVRAAWTEPGASNAQA